MKKIVFVLLALTVLTMKADAQTLTWKYRQQLMIVPTESNTRPLAVLDSAIFQAVARTSANVPVNSPGVTWNLRDSSGVTLIKTSTSTVIMYPMNILRERTTWLVASWKTSSGTFRDSMPVTLRFYVPRTIFHDPVATPTWRKGQQLFIQPTHFGQPVPPTMLIGDNKIFTALARTSTGVPVTAFSVSWQLRNGTNVKLTPMTNTSVRLDYMAPLDTLPPAKVVWLVGTWTTKSGLLKDSVRVFMSNVTLASSIAFADSFPPANRHILLASGWGHKIPKAYRDSIAAAAIKAASTTTAKDSIRILWEKVDASPDSIYTPQTPYSNPPAPVNVVLGYQYQICWIAKNRYTGAVILLGPDISGACGRVRTDYEQLRNGAD